MNSRNYDVAYHKLTDERTMKDKSCYACGEGFKDGDVVVSCAGEEYKRGILQSARRYYHGKCFNFLHEQVEV